MDEHVSVEQAHMDAIRREARGIEAEVEALPAEEHSQVVAWRRQLSIYRQWVAADLEKRHVVLAARSLEGMREVRDKLVAYFEE